MCFDVMGHIEACQSKKFYKIINIQAIFHNNINTNKGISILNHAKRSNSNINLKFFQKIEYLVKYF